MAYVRQMQHVDYKRFVIRKREALFDIEEEDLLEDLDRNSGKGL